MKKLFKVLGLLTIAAALFVGCDEPKDATGGPSTGSSSGEISFDDCTTTVSSAADISLASGTWTFKCDQTSEDDSRTYNFKASVIDSGNYTFTSGTGTYIDSFDLEIEYEKNPTALETFNELTDDAQKKQWIIENEYAGYPEGTIISISLIDGIKVTATVTYPFPETGTDSVAKMQKDFALANLPTDAEIKTNSTKTKYVISYTIIEDADKGQPYVINFKLYLSKD